MTTFDRIDLSKYLVISIWFNCNNNCSTCMLSELREKLPPIGFDSFKKIVIDMKNKGLYKNLILSGAEVTTCKDLDRYIQYAASMGYFDKIQIQTNGRKFSDMGYLGHLLDLGVNEFFISLYGNEEVHDRITRKPGSYRETVRGIKNIESFDVGVISNSVLSRINLEEMPDLIRFIAGRKISEIHLWNYFPMKEIDGDDYLVSMNDFLKLLPELTGIAKAVKKPLVLKGFPECIPSMPPLFFDSYFPETVLPNMFWEKFSESGFGYCIYRDRCSSSSCWGLSKAYVNKFGDARELLSPID